MIILRISFSRIRFTIYLLINNQTIEGKIILYYIYNAKQLKNKLLLRKKGVNFYEG